MHLHADAPAAFYCPQRPERTKARFAGGVVLIVFKDRRQIGWWAVRWPMHDSQAADGHFGTDVNSGFAFEWCVRGNACRVTCPAISFARCYSVFGGCGRSEAQLVAVHRLAGVSPGCGGPGRDVLLLPGIVGLCVESFEVDPLAAEYDHSDCGLRVMAYCHDSVGIGHLRRTLAICERIEARHRNSCFLMATGTPYVQFFGGGSRVDCIKLPALRKLGDGTYRSKFLSVPSARVMRCRESVLRGTAEHFAPHVLLVDKAPLGVCRELLPTLRWLKRNRPGTLLIFGMRDIEDEAQATVRQWRRDGVADVLAECYDEIWVYGRRDIYDVVAEYQLPDTVAKKTRFMGYVTRGPCTHAATSESTPDDAVLVTVGGGTDGEFVLRTYLDAAAARVARLGLQSILIGGPDLPRDIAATLKQQADAMDGVVWRDVESCMSCRMKQVRLVVSMGGYNTMCELAAHRKPAIIIPRTTPRKEQLIRAELWERLNLVTPVRREALTPQSLGAEVERQLLQPPTPRRTFPMAGLDNVANRFDQLVGEGRDALAVHL